MPPTPRFRPCWLVVFAAVLGLLGPAALPSARAQTRPVHVRADQATQAPYRDSGRIFVQQGLYAYTGTATVVRRHTGLTAGHMLYEPVAGFSTEVRYEPAVYGEPTDLLGATALVVLAGYQAAAGVGVESREAFALDLGYLLFDRPATDNRWAVWSTDPAFLERSGDFLALGYAGETVTPTILSQMSTDRSYTLALAPGLYENEGYVSEGGTSGGPVYAAGDDGARRVAAVTVAGSSTRQRTFSAVRALTPAEGIWLAEAEYTRRAITGGFIKGPAVTPRGRAVKYKTGVVFADGTREASTWAAHYDEAVLVAGGPHKKSVQVTRLHPGKFAVRFADDLPPGATVKLLLLRNTAPRQGQTPLATLQVTVP